MQIHQLQRILYFCGYQLSWIEENLHFCGYFISCFWQIWSAYMPIICNSLNISISGSPVASISTKIGNQCMNNELTVIVERNAVKYFYLLLLHQDFYLTVTCTNHLTFLNYLRWITFLPFSWSFWNTGLRRCQTTNYSLKFIMYVKVDLLWHKIVCLMSLFT